MSPPLLRPASPLGRNCLTNDGNLNLARIGHFISDFLSNFERKRLGLVVIYTTCIYHHPDFPSCIDGVGVFHTLKRTGHVFQISNPPDIIFRIIPTGAGTRATRSQPISSTMPTRWITSGSGRAMPLQPVKPMSLDW